MIVLYDAKYGVFREISQKYENKKLKIIFLRKKINNSTDFYVNLCKQIN